MLKGRATTVGFLAKPGFSRRETHLNAVPLRRLLFLTGAIKADLVSEMPESHKTEIEKRTIFELAI